MAIDLQSFFAIDHGFGGIKYAWYDNAGKMKRGKYLSIIAYSLTPVAGLPKFEDRWWYVGEQALLQPSDTIIEIKDYNTLKRFSALLLYSALVRAGKLQAISKLKIVAGLSSAHSSDAANFKAALSNWVVDDISYKATIAFQEQGRGAFYTLQKILDKKEKGGEPPHYMIVDIGFNTMDIVFVSDGIILRIVPHEEKGFIQLASVMKARIHAEHNRVISLKEAAAIIDTGFYTLRGEKFPKEKLIAKMKSDYTEGLMKFLEKHYGEYIDKMPKLYFVGGGGYVIDEKYSKNIKVVEDAEYYNVIGNLLRAQEL